MRLIFRAGVACALGAFFAAAGAAQAAQTPAVRVRDTAAFTVLNAPAAPLDLYESALRFAPAVSTGAYLHAGAEYGIIVAGRVTRSDGEHARVLAQGDSFLSAPGAVSESRASRGAVQISAFLQPRGMRVEKTRATAIFLNRFAAAAPPAPFTLVEQLVDIAPGGSTVRFAYGGTAYGTVAEGEIAVEKQGIVTRYRLGEPFTAGAGETVRLMNLAARAGSVQVVVLLPEAVHFTRPPRAY